MFIGTPSTMEDCEERKLRVNELNGVNKILSWHWSGKSVVLCSYLHPESEHIPSGSKSNTSKSNKKCYI